LETVKDIDPHIPADIIVHPRVPGYLFDIAHDDDQHIRAVVIHMPREREPVAAVITGTA
jgi:hypothetical protein